MADYLSNSVFKYDYRRINNYKVRDYSSMDLLKITEYINDCEEDMFDWYQIDDNSNLEKIALDLYGNPDYWDIIILLNHRIPLEEFPYDFDAIANITEEKVKTYTDEIYGDDLPLLIYNTMYNKFEYERLQKNEEYRVIKIVKPSKIQRFFQKGYELGCFK